MSPDIMDHQRGEHDSMQAGSPPAYDDLYGSLSPVSTSIPKIIEVGGIVHDNIASWTRKHSLLILVAFTGQPAGKSLANSNGASTIVLLIRDSKVLSVVFSGQASMEDFHSIHGAQVVGDFMLTLNGSAAASKVADELSIALSTERDSEADPARYADTILDVDQARNLISRVERLQPQEHQGVMPSQIRLILGTAFSSQEDLLHVSDRHILWKWCKPESVYNTLAGKWEKDIQSCVEDAHWNAGSEFQLMVKAVDAAEFERVINSPGVYV